MGTIEDWNNTLYLTQTLDISQATLGITGWNGLRVLIEIHDYHLDVGLSNSSWCRS